MTGARDDAFRCRPALPSRCVVVGTIVLVSTLVLTPSTAAADDLEIKGGGKLMSGLLVRMERGRLFFWTSATGTIAIDWTHVVGISSPQNLDVELSAGGRFSGSISSPSAGQLVVQTSSGPTAPIVMSDIVRIAPIQATFRMRLTGVVDFGLSYSHADAELTYAFNSAWLHRTRSYETRVGFDSWLSRQDDADRQTRNDLVVDVRRLLPERWFALALVEAQQDEDLDLDLRLLAGGGVGRTVVQSNRTSLALKGGVDYNAEQYADADSRDHSVELFGGAEWAWFQFAGFTQVDVDSTTFVSLERRRVRVELDADARRIVFWSPAWNFFWAANVFESFDSDPRGDRKRSDLGVSFALGFGF